LGGAFDNVFDYRPEMMQLSVLEMINVHNIFAKVCASNKVEQFLIRGRDKDPIYLIFSAMRFREIDKQNYTHEVHKYLLNMEVNTKFFQYDWDGEDYNMFQCPDCDLIFPKDYLKTSYEDFIDQNKREGWDCDAETHPQLAGGNEMNDSDGGGGGAKTRSNLNTIRDFHCKYPNCEGTIKSSLHQGFSFVEK
jgi:uncharacterized C2H2 Zn-finger protein